MATVSGSIRLCDASDTGWSIHFATAHAPGPTPWGPVSQIECAHTVGYIMGSSLQSVGKDTGLGLTTHVQEIMWKVERNRCGI